MLTRYCCFLFLLSLLMAPATAQPTLSLAGIVASDGQGVAGVTVVLSGARTDTTVTDAQGNYVFEDLLPGEYTVAPQHPGYTFSPEQFSLSIGATSAFLPLFEAARAVGVETEPDPGALLYPNYPNPFTDVTEIRFELAAPGPVTLDVYDLLGRWVENLAAGTYSAGTHRVRFAAGNLPNGLYMIRLHAGIRVQTRLMTLMR